MYKRKCAYLLVIVSLLLFINNNNNVIAQATNQGIQPFVINAVGDTLTTVNDAMSVIESAPPDTLCFETEIIRRMEQDITRLEFRDSLQTELIGELRGQNERYRNLVVRDSIVIANMEQRVEIFRDRIAIRDERINELQSQVEAANRQRYWWLAGGVALSVGTAIIVNALSGDGTTTVVTGGGHGCGC